MATVFDIKNALNEYFPFCEAEVWDNSGLLVDGGNEISKIIVALDATNSVINEAKGLGAELIVSHHPIIFHPLKTLCANEPSVNAVKNSISIISAHTNYDISSFGADQQLSSILKEKLGFENEGFLETTQSAPISRGFGRYGKLKKEYSSEEFALVLKDIFNCQHIRFVSSSKKINKIAFCCGGGSEYLEKAQSLMCDAFITADVKHSAFISASNTGTALYAPTHYQMEKPAMKNMADLLLRLFPDIEIVQSKNECEPSKII